MQFSKRYLLYLAISVLLASGAYAQIKGEQSVVAGRDINARDIIIKYGLTEQEVLAIFRDLQKKEGSAVQKVAGSKYGDAPVLMCYHRKSKLLVIKSAS